MTITSCLQATGSANTSTWHRPQANRFWDDSPCEHSISCGIIFHMVTKNVERGEKSILKICLKTAACCWPVRFSRYLPIQCGIEHGHSKTFKRGSSAKSQLVITDWVSSDTYVLHQHISMYCTFHDGCKEGIDLQIFNRKSISCKITHTQYWKLQANITGEKLKGWSSSREKTNSRIQSKFRKTSSLIMTS